MEELQWPVDICESCGFNLREATPKAKEKSNDASNRLKWTDFCPQCGRGMFVGDRVVPLPPSEVLTEREAKPVLSFLEDKELEKTKDTPSGILPDERGAALAKDKEENPDPEDLLSQEPATPPGETPEPGAIKSPSKGQYFCTKCASVHRLSSKVGKRHISCRE